VNDPESCQHDFKRVFPRHVTAQAPTRPEEKVLAVLCSGCGKSPIYFEQLGSKNRPLSIRPTGSWPENLQITDYEWGRDTGPAVKFRVLG
jgi:hypothetical protein